MDSNSGQGRRYPAWLSLFGVGAGYGLLLLVMTVLLFLVPFAVFVWF